MVTISRPFNTLRQSDNPEDPVSHLYEVLRPRVADLRSFTTDVAPFPDATRKYMAFDAKRRPFAVVIMSSPVTPDMVANRLELKKAACGAIGSLSEVVLEPLDWGWTNGVSYAIYPFCRRLSGSRLGWAVQRVWIRKQVLKWLRAATEVSLSRPTEAELEEYFAAPLRYVAGWQAMPATARRAAATALGRLDDGSWQPRFCLIHGDLWKGNILLAPSRRSRHRFVLIDWGDSRVRGHGIQDLLTLAGSMKLRGAALLRELEAHCRILGCDREDARSYLTASQSYYAVSHYGQNVGFFPLENFIGQFQGLLDQLDACGL